MAGILVVIGGAEDNKKHGNILETVLRLSGVKNPDVAVIAAAAAEPRRAGRDYEQIFERLGAASVRVLELASRRSAQDPAAGAGLRGAPVIFLTGGDQLRLTSILGGTILLHKLKEHFMAGAVLAGTSAGAAALSATMIVGGYDDSPPQRDLIQMSPGLGFLSRAIIDQHFAQRGRFGRLFSAVAFNPSLLGIGIDEDTAVIVRDNRRLEVVGSHGATIIDGSTLMQTNVSETAPEETLTLSSFRLHILARGARFDLERACLEEPDSEACP